MLERCRTFVVLYAEQDKHLQSIQKNTCVFHAVCIAARRCLRIGNMTENYHTGTLTNIVENMKLVEASDRSRVNAMGTAFLISLVGAIAYTTQI